MSFDFPFVRLILLLSLFHTGASQEKPRKLARSFILTYCYIDDFLSLNKYRFDDFADRIYPAEIEIKDSTCTDSSASYLDRD